MKLFRSERRATESPKRIQAGQSEAATSLSRAAERVGELAAGATRAVAEIGADAKRHRVEARPGTPIDRDRLVSEMMQAIEERAEALEQEAHELSRLLARASAQIAASEPAASREPGTPFRPMSPDRSAELSRLVQRSGSDSEGLRLLTTQMAIAGSSRREIEDRLRREFGVADANALLDGVLGPRS